jgi:dUTP pyrophosphatase
MSNFNTEFCNNNNINSNILNQIRNKFPTNTKFAVLRFVIDSNELPENIVNSYKYAISKHNNEILQTIYPNSGFDLLVPNDVNFHNAFETVFINHSVKGEMIYYDSDLNTWEPSAYQLLPRSSISKTPLMMANHIGIIDSCYRGDLIAAVRYLPLTTNNLPDYKVESKTRLFQICHPSLCPIYVHVVNQNELTETTRGEGGFGSTGV